MGIPKFTLPKFYPPKIYPPKVYPPKVYPPNIYLPKVYPPKVIPEFLKFLATQGEEERGQIMGNIFASVLPTAQNLLSLLIYHIHWDNIEYAFILHCIAYIYILC